MAKVSWICVSEHVGEQLMLPGPTITLNDQMWAYCRLGGAGEHAWRRADELTSVEHERFAPSDQYEIGRESFARGAR